MQLEYGKAPLSYTNGIPTYKAGEWEGILPCKFHSYKRVIRPLDQGIIVNNNPVFYPKKKVLIPSNSPEFIFKPSFKVTNIEFNHEEKPKGIKHIYFKTEPRKFMVEKKHYFPYKEQKKLYEKERDKSMTNDNYVKKEMKLLIVENGFAKTKYKNFSNRKFNGFAFLKEQLDNVNMNDNDFEPNKTMTQIRNERIKNRLIKKKNLLFDISYVENLDIWEKGKIGNLKKNSTLPIINNKNLGNNNNDEEKKEEKKKGK